MYNGYKLNEHYLSHPKFRSIYTYYVIQRTLNPFDLFMLNIPPYVLLLLNI